MLMIEISIMFSFFAKSIGKKIFFRIKFDNTSILCS